MTNQIILGLIGWAIGGAIANYYIVKLSVVRSQMNAVTHLRRLIIGYIKDREKNAPGGVPNVTRYEKELLSTLQDYMETQDMLIDEATPALFHFIQDTALDIHNKIQARRAKKTDV